MAVFDSGWVEISTNLNFSFEHGLGTDKLTGAVYYTDENQNSMISVGTSYGFGSNNEHNAMLSIISDTHASVSLGADGYATRNGISSWKPFLSPTYIKLILISSEESSPPGSGGNSGGSSGWQFLDSPIDIKTETSSSAGNWITIPANSSLTNSTNLLIQGQTTDLDTGGNSNCELVCRENASGPEVTIIDHDGTSGQRSVAVEQAIIPCNSDGSFDIKFTTSGNIAIAHLKIVGYSLGVAASSSGDLCKLKAQESGYQMFGNGLIMQWFSSNEITLEQAYDITFPTPFLSKPFKVIVSTRYPTGDGISQIWFQTIDWNKDSVQFYAQAQNFSNFTAVIADFYAIGLATPTDCSGGDGASAVDGVKISQLSPATELKDDDLFVLSKDDESDGIYDHSNKITFQQIKENILPDTQGSSTITLIAPKLIKANTVGGAWNPIPFEQIDLSDDLPIGAQGCILQVEAYVTGPNDSVHAEIFLRKEQNSTTQYKILYTAAFGGGDAVAGNYQGFYPIHQASRSIWIGVPQRGPDRYEIYLVGYF